MAGTDQERRPTFIAMLRAHAELVSERKSLDKTLAHLARGAADLAGASILVSMICVVNPETLERQQDLYGTSRLASQADRVGLVTQAIASRQIQVVHDFDLHPALTVRYHGVRSSIAIPLVAAGKCWGALALDSGRPRHFDAELVPWLEAVAIEALQTVQSDTMRAGLEVDRVATGYWMSPDRLYTTLRVIAWEALEQLVGRHASVEILVLSSAGDNLVSLALESENRKRPLPGRYTPGTTISWRAVRERRPVYYANVARNTPRASLNDTRTALVLPLFGEHKQVIGALNVESSEADALNYAEAILEPFRERAQHVLHNAARETSALLAAAMTDIGEEIANLVGPRDLISPYQLVLRRAIQLIDQPDLKAALVFLQNEELTIRSEHTYRYAHHDIKDYAWPTSRGVTGRAVTAQHSIIVNDVEHDPDYFASSAEAQSELVVPLLRARAVIGVIDILSPMKGAFTQRHQDMIESLAGRVVHALDRVEQIHRGHVALERMALIQDTYAVMGTGSPLNKPGELRDARQKILLKLIDTAKQVTGSEYGEIIRAIRLPEGLSRSKPATATELVRVLRRFPRHRMGKIGHWPATQGVTGKVYRERKPHLVLEASLDPDFKYFSSLEVRSSLTVPIVSDDEVLGVLNLESVKPRAYSHEQIEWISLLASQIASVLAAADLRLLRRHLTRLITLQTEVMVESLFDGGLAISDQLQRHILQAALDLTEQADGYASLWLTHGDRLRRHNCFTYSDGISNEALDDHAAGIVKLALEAEQPVLALDLDEARWRKLVYRNWTDARSELAVPLLDPERRPGEPGRVLGVLNVESRRPLELDHRHVEILEPLARLTVAAIRHRDVYRSKVAQVADITHTCSKVLYPLRVAIEDLQSSLRPGNRVDGHIRQIDEVAALSDLANRVLGWFQQLVPGTDMRTPVELRKEELRHLLREFVHWMQFFADDRYKSLELVVPARDLVVECHAGVIQAALFLLTDNALRYGPENDRVIVRLRRNGDRQVRIEVIDHGKPIPEAERDFLFEPGFRGSTAHLAHQRHVGPGSGLGLDHVRRIVEKVHHGRAGYKSARGENRFFVVIPLTQAKSTQSSS